MKILGMGGFEFVIILIVVLLIFGPKNLPKLGKALGKSVSSLREGMSEGKKKNGAAEDEAAPAQPDDAENGTVEVVAELEEPAEPAASPAASAEAETDTVIADAEKAAADAEAAADEAFEPKKVRRVVRKKAE